ncbi:MAG: hypothetical protein AAF566_11460 [Pseudomonadota bacterium]
MIIGAPAALVLANIGANGDHDGFEVELIHDVIIGHAHHDSMGQVECRSLTLHDLINGVLMAFFLSIAAKDV